MRGDSGFAIRLRHNKRGPVRFISHRDVARAFERAFRIVTLPTAFTQGFSPRPKISFGLALSVGCESDAEYLDVELIRPIEPLTLVAPISEALPVGIDITGIVSLEDRAPALQKSVTAVSYVISFDPVDDNGLSERVQNVLNADSVKIERHRKGESRLEDIRSSFRSIELLDPWTLACEVETQPRGVRMSEIVAALGGDLSIVSGLRTNQWIERDGARLEPLEADSRLRVPEVRASRGGR